jgi:probable HAF family extracellular repeat protein
MSVAAMCRYGAPTRAADVFISHQGDRMRRSHARTSVALALWVPLSCLAGAAAPTYDCAYLQPALPGTNSYPTAINEHGTVAGEVEGDWPVGRTAAVWMIGSGPRILDWGDRYYTEALDINDRGHVAGAGATFDEGTRALLWRHGQAITLPRAPGEYVGDRALALNNDAVIVGVIPTTTGFSHHAAVWHGDRLFDLGTLGGPKGQADRSSIATDINEAGVVVGQSQVYRYKPHRGMHAVRWEEAKTIVDLGTLPGGLVSMAMKISNNGIVAGYSEFEGGGTRLHATVWAAGEIRDLGALPGHDESFAKSVNDAGVAVGHSFNPPETTWRAVAWYAGDEGPTDLNTLVDMATCPDAEGTAYTLQGAEAINSSGQIAARGRSVVGQVYAGFRLTPR